MSDDNTNLLVTLITEVRNDTKLMSAQLSVLTAADLPTRVAGLEETRSRAHGAVWAASLLSGGLGAAIAKFFSNSK